MTIGPAESVAPIRSGKWLGLCLFVLALFCGPWMKGEARAQAVGIDSKSLCNSLPAAGNVTECPDTSAPAFAAIWYKIIVDNSAGSTVSVVLTEKYPGNFQFVGVACATQNGAPVAASTVAGGTPITVSMPAGQKVACLVKGYFTGFGSATNIVTSGNASHESNIMVESNAPLPADLRIEKTASVTSVDISGAPATIEYTIVVTNAGPSDVYLGQLLTIRDSLSLYSNGVPLSVAYVAGSAACSSTLAAHCVAAAPATIGSPPLSGNFVPFLEWRFPTAGSDAPGFIPIGGTITIKYRIRVDRNPLITCIRQPGSDGLRNKAELILDPPGPSSSLADLNTGNNSSMAPGVSAQTGITAIDSHCGSSLKPSPLRVTKIQVPPNPSGGFPWPSKVAYRITITNLTNKPLIGIEVSDFVMSIPGSPPFDAARTAQPMHSCPGLTFQPTPAVQSVNGYYTPASLGKATLALPPGQTCKITAFEVTYSKETCDSFVNYNNPIRNVARAVWTGTWTPSGGQPLTGTFVAEDSNDVDGVLKDTLMGPGKACRLTVTKTPMVHANPRIRFGVMTQYSVAFTNNEPFAVSVGTLYDALRIVQSNYAVNLTVGYKFSCPPVAGITNAPWLGVGTTTVVHTQYPHQGARIINGGAGPGPVVFGKNTTLICTIGIWVKQPPPSQPYCLSAVDPELENAALMATPADYSSNGPWPPSASYDGIFPYPAIQPAPIPAPWGTVITALPKCFNLQINKGAQPSITWTTSPDPLIYTITARNFGDAFVATGFDINDWSGPVIKDSFTVNFPAPAKFVSLSPAGCCTWLTGPSNPVAGDVLASDFLLGIGTMAAAGQPGDTVTLKFKVDGPYVEQKIVNQATEFRTGSAGAWYSNDPASCFPGNIPFVTLPPAGFHASVADSCVEKSVPVLGVGSVNVLKILNNPTGLATLPLFSMTLTCTFKGQPTIWQLQVPPGTAGVTQTNIPETSQCKVHEPPLAFIPPSLACPYGAIWSQAIAPQSQTVVKDQTVTIKVTNTLACKPKGPGLTIKKVIAHPAQGNLLTSAPPPFKVDISCDDGFVGSVTLTGTAPQTVYGPAAGAKCTLIETLPTSPFPGNCPLPMFWMAPTITPSPVIVGASGTPVTVTNRYQCLAPLGALRITKKVILDGNLTVAVPFVVQVSCGWPNAAPSWNANVTLGGSQPSTKTVSPIPLGMTCTVRESPPPPLSFWTPPCRWLTIYPGSATPDLQHSTTVTAATKTLIIQNEQTCSTIDAPGEAELEITKHISVNGMTMVTQLPPMTFDLVLKCTGQPDLYFAMTTSSDGTESASGSLPAGTTCTIDEPSQGPPPVVPTGCSWSGLSYEWSDGISSGTGAILTLGQAGRRYAFEVYNALTCPP